MSTHPTQACTRCGKSFVPRLSYQTVQAEGVVSYYCSQRCRDPGIAGASVECSVCKTAFVPTLAAHVREAPGSRLYLCSEICAAKLAAPVEATPSEPPPRAIAVLNQKGGTAKTTTSLSVAAGLAQVGERTLLIDLDPQGNVGISLGVKGPRSIFHVMVQGLPVQACVVQARENLDVITADESLAAAEIHLARTDEGSRTFALQRALASLRGYRYVVFDCAPSLSILNHNALVYAGEVLIPVSCDYLALVGVKQVLRTLRRIGEQTGRDVRIAGVLPTFFDQRNKVSTDTLGHLRQTFGARMLPPVRVNTRLAEAPSFKKTIFEHAGDSNGARDYIRVVEWLRAGSDSVTRAA